MSQTSPNIPQRRCSKALSKVPQWSPKGPPNGPDIQKVLPVLQTCHSLHLLGHDHPAKALEHLEHSILVWHLISAFAVYFLMKWNYNLILLEKDKNHFIHEKIILFFLLQFIFHIHSSLHQPNSFIH